MARMKSNAKNTSKKPARPTPQAKSARSAAKKTEKQTGSGKADQAAPSKKKATAKKAEKAEKKVEQKAEMKKAGMKAEKKSAKTAPKAAPKKAEKKAPKKAAPKKAAPKKAAPKKAAPKKAEKKAAPKKAEKKADQKTSKSAAKAEPKKAAGKKAAGKKAAGKKAAASKSDDADANGESEGEGATSSLPALALPKAGNRAPNFMLPADDGSQVSLSSLKGKKVILYFYPKDDTPGCTTEACAFRDLHSEFKKRGAVVLGVSKDSVKKHQSFKSKYDLPFQLLSDQDAEVIGAYGSWGQKTFMGRTFDGILRTTVLIDQDGKIAKVYPKVSVKEHADEVLKDLEQL